MLWFVFEGGRGYGLVFNLFIFCCGVGFWVLGLGLWMMRKALGKGRHHRADSDNHVRNPSKQEQ